MITSSDQDKCSMPIQDYLSGVHSRGHPLNQKHAVSIVCPPWHNSGPGIPGFTLLCCCQSSSSFYLLRLMSVSKLTTVCAFHVCFFFFICNLTLWRWQLHSSHTAKHLFFLKIKTSHTLKTPVGHRQHLLLFPDSSRTLLSSLNANIYSRRNKEIVPCFPSGDTCVFLKPCSLKWHLLLCWSAFKTLTCYHTVCAETIKYIKQQLLTWI